MTQSTSASLSPEKHQKNLQWIFLCKLTVSQSFSVRFSRKLGATVSRRQKWNAVMRFLQISLPVESRSGFAFGITDFKAFSAFLEELAVMLIVRREGRGYEKCSRSVGGEISPRFNPKFEMSRELSQIQWLYCILLSTIPSWCEFNLKMGDFLATTTHLAAPTSFHFFSIPTIQSNKYTQQQTMPIDDRKPILPQLLACFMCEKKNSAPSSLHPSFSFFHTQRRPLPPISTPFSWPCTFLVFFFLLFPYSFPSIIISTNSTPEATLQHRVVRPNCVINLNLAD